MALINSLPCLGKSRQYLFWSEASGGESRTNAIAKALEMVLLRHENESVPKLQNGERGTRFKAKIFTKLFWNGDLALLADPGRSQEFKHCWLICHT